eukprot:TRINITY_DN28751_c0_g1_i2.p1 TRINITY_DN28751_c0_g1~~TRINITY_DN28751_c0_g1_i2.p1  ORF type:complete len:151 (+),score=34.28 TRINITY_DN28751_c0_g1_i2:215-667(+)
MDLMRNMAELAALNPQRAKSHLQTSGLGADVRLSMLSEMNLTASDRVQLKGDIIGSDKIRTAERRAAAEAHPQDAARRADLYSGVRREISGSSLDPQHKSEYLQRIPGPSEARALTLHNCGDYRESSHTTARLASFEYGRRDLHRVSSYE